MAEEIMNNKWHGIAAMVERVATRKGRVQNGRFSIEGYQLHQLAIEAGACVEQALVGEQVAKGETAVDRKLLTNLEAMNCQIAITPDKVLTDLSNGRGLGDVFGLIRLPPPARLTDFMAGREQTLLLVAIDVRDPGNAGAMVRTALGLGTAAFIAVGDTDPFHPKAVRTAMGGVFALPILRYETYAPLAVELAACGVQTVATVPVGGMRLGGVGFLEKTAVLLGNEARGLPSFIRESADVQTTIPMSPKLESFSVNVAAAILLYEAGRGAKTCLG